MKERKKRHSSNLAEQNKAMMSARHFNKINFNPRPVGIKSWSHLGQFRMVRKHCLKSSCIGLVAVFSPWGRGFNFCLKTCCNVNYRFGLVHTGCNCPAAPHKLCLWGSGPVALKGNNCAEIAGGVYLRSVAQTHWPLCVCVCFCDVTCAEIILL